MSNVLIGIIGVILFIGLALAGALFLGPRFQQSTNNAKASAAVQAVSQISSAANMSNVQNGTTVSALSDTPTTLSTAGFLKSVPSNPVSGGTAPALYDAAGKTGTGAGDAKFVLMSLGTSGDQICAAIAKQSGDSRVTTSTSGVDTAYTASDMTGFTGPSGCVKLGTAVTGGAAAGYYAYAAI